MFRSLVSIAVLFTLLTACSPATAPTSAPSLEPEAALPTVTDLPAAAASTAPVEEPTLPVKAPEKTLELSLTPEKTAEPTLAASSTIDQPAGPDFSGVQDYTPAFMSFLGDNFNNTNIHAVDYRSDLKLLAVAGCIFECSEVMGGGGFLILLDEDQLKPLRSIPIDKTRKIFDVDIAPSGKSLIYSFYGQILEYDIAADSTRVFWKNPINDSAPFSFYSPDGKYLAVSASKQIFILDASTGQQVSQILNSFIGSSWSSVFNQQGNRLTIFSGEDRSQAVIYEVGTWQVLSKIPTPKPSVVAVSPDGKLAAVSIAENPEIKLIDLQSGVEQWVLQPQYEKLVMMRFNPSGSLLIASGRPQDDADMYDVFWMIDAKTGRDLGRLLDIDYPGLLQFSADGESFVAFSGSMYSLRKWGPKTDELKAAEALLREYFGALAGGDYQKAAGLSSLDAYSVEDVKNAGLDPKDLPAAFEALCAQDEVPCLPLGRVAYIGMDRGEPWNYMALVTLALPDGTEHRFDDISPYEYIGIVKNAQGQLRVASLHPGMRYPFE